jgi:pyruvate dehydrogenase E2 component (dihydrolipoamide acetyltransferase)
MAEIVGLPKLSPTMEEGTLARWAKSEGDDIAIDDLIAEVETDKATMEWRAFDKGVLLKILVPAGTTLKPDTPVAIVGKRGEDLAPLLAKLAGGAMPVAAAPPAEPVLAKLAGGSPPAAAAPLPAPAVTVAGPAPAVGTREAAPPVASATGEGRVMASPLVRRLAREHDVDLRTVGGSGPHGRIVKRDLDAALARGAAGGRATQAAPMSPPSRGERLPPVEQPLSQMRKTIARRLTESKQNVPHFYLSIEVDAQPLSEARARINQELEASGEKVSVNDLLLKAVALALRKVPGANASFLGDRIALHQCVDLSVAVSVPDGLVTPVVRDADRKSVLEISREVRELASKAKSKKLKPEEMSGGTFSVSNLGMFGIDEFSAVINPPEGAILAVGAVREVPVVSGGAVVPGKTMKMTLSCDHRVVDGALGATYLAALKKLLEAPVLMLV